MTRILAFLDRLPLSYALIIAAGLGLAPFTPVPHVWEKLAMLASGALVNPVDIFDLGLHGTPWLLLAAKLGRIAATRRQA